MVAEGDVLNLMKYELIIDKEGYLVRNSVGEEFKMNNPNDINRLCEILNQSIIDWDAARVTVIKQNVFFTEEKIRLLKEFEHVLSLLHEKAQRIELGNEDLFISDDICELIKGVENERKTFEME